MIGLHGLSVFVSLFPFFFSFLCILCDFVVRFLFVTSGSGGGLRG